MTGWFRWYRDAASDPKFKIIAEELEASDVTTAEVVGVWIAILERCDSHGDVTVTCRDTNGTAVARYVSVTFDMDRAKAFKIVSEFVAMGMLVEEGSRVRVPKWQQRQWTDTTAAERKRRQRARQRGESDVTTVTRDSHASETETETETEYKNTPSPTARRVTRKSTEKRATTKPLLNANAYMFQQFYEVYPRRIGRRAAEKAFAAAVKRGKDPLVIVAAAQLYATDVFEKATPARFIPHPSTWLNRDSFLDDLSEGESDVDKAFKQIEEVANDRVYRGSAPSRVRNTDDAKLLPKPPTDHA